MNLLLFPTREPTYALPRADPRAGHIREVLRMAPGDEFFVGAANGPRGKATYALAGDSLILSVTWEDEIPTLRDVGLVCGLPRPQAARRILQEATSLGCAFVSFFQSVRGEPSYARSTLWTSDEWRRHLHLGAEQAFTTRLPEVHHQAGLAEALEALPEASQPVALDVYEATGALNTLRINENRRPVLVIGPERGWDARERDLLRERTIPLLHLGERVLRVETACTAGLSVLLTLTDGWH